jgi:type III restriction enzyme
VEPDPAKAEVEIQWPNVVRIDRVFLPALTLDWSKAQTLELSAAQTAAGMVRLCRGAAA